MIVESSAQFVRNQLGSLVVDFRLAEHEGGLIALDIVEFIAVRMNDRRDEDVRELAFYVHVNLIALLANRMAFSALLERFTDIALAATLGRVAFTEVLHNGSRACRG